MLAAHSAHPRLVGVERALDMVTTGRHLPAQEALASGLVDAVVASDDPRAVALEFAEQARTGALATRKTGAITVDVDSAVIAAWSEGVQAKAPHLFSPLKCVEAVAASHLPIREGAALERDLFSQCMESPQRKGLIHAFFSERAVAKIPEANAIPRDLNQLGVIGGGTMGSGIASSMLLAGFPVTLVERDAAAANRTQETITGNLAGAVARGKMSEAKRDAALAGLKVTTAMEDLASADLIIEAVFEEMDVKKSVFSQLDKIAKPGAILASNTSYLDINQIAAMTTRPNDVIGLHFFSPAHIMRLLEVVVADKTAPEVVATGFALGKRLRKVAVRAGVCDGFIGNRILTHYRKVADYLHLDGASHVQIDKALEEFGFAMGPFAVADLAGLDIGWAARKRQALTPAGGGARRVYRRPHL